jgi:transposase
MEVAMWRVGIEVRQDITAPVLRKKARSEKDGKVASRLFGIANILDGIDRERAAQLAGMTRQTLRDWVHRYNEQGIDGLKDRPRGHAKRALTPEQEKEIERLVFQGPDGTLVRWRCIDLQAVIKKKFGVSYHERSVGKILHRLGFVRLSVRPLHPGSDPEAQEAFKKTSPPELRTSCLNMPKTKSSSSGSKTKRVSGRKEP